MDPTPVAPIVRNEFLYQNNILSVDVGGPLKRHVRASAAEIESYLSNKTDKDQVAHWYEAQLIHYGLQRSKEKNTAKVRLQAALNRGELVQPKQLEEMEKSMKKDFTSAVRKAKATSNKNSVVATGGETVKASTPAKGQKRKRNDGPSETVQSASKRINLSTTNDDTAANAQHGEEAPTSKKVGAKSASATRTATTVNSKKVAEPTTTKATAKKASKLPSKPKTGLKTAEVSKEAVPKATAASNKKSQPNPNSTLETSTSRLSPGKIKPKAKAKAVEKSTTSKTTVQASDKVTTSKATSNASTKNGKESLKKTNTVPKIETLKQTKSGPKVKKEPQVRPPFSSRKIKQEVLPQGHDSDTEMMDAPTSADAFSHNLSRTQETITGVYILECPQLAEQLPEFSDGFRLFLHYDPDTDTLWGGFSLANKFGTIRVQQASDGFDAWDGNMLRGILPFEWRARDEWSQSLKFGRGCSGHLELLGVNGIEGAFHGLFNEVITFEGYKKAGPPWSGKGPEQYEYEWDEYVRETYG